MALLGESLRGFYRYDPSYPLYNKRPTEGYDIVVCTDVLEHLDDEDAIKLIKEVDSLVLSGGIALYTISIIPSRNSFLDGTNMHINLKSKEEWYSFMRHNTHNEFLIKF